MSEEKFMSVVGVFLILSHFITLFLVLMLTILDRFTKPELFTAVGLILPLFASYTTIIVHRFLSLTKEKPPDPKLVPFPRIFVALFIPSVFVLFVLAGIFWKAFGSLDFDSFRTMLGVGETAFGIYIGMIVKSMFERR